MIAQVTQLGSVKQGFKVRSALEEEAKMHTWTGSQSEQGQESRDCWGLTKDTS